MGRNPYHIHPASLTPHTNQNRANGTAGKPAFLGQTNQPMRRSDSYPHQASRNPPIQRADSLGSTKYPKNADDKTTSYPLDRKPEKDFQLYQRLDRTKQIQMKFFLQIAKE